MNHAGTNARRVAAVSAISAIGLMGMAAPASAAPVTTTSSTQECIITPAFWKTIVHEEQAHQEYRWLRTIPGQNEVSHQEGKFFRLIPGHSEVSYEQWRYSRFIEGKDEVSHQEYQFSRQNPGQSEVSHEQWLYSRFIEGKDEVSHQEYQFSRQNPGQSEVSHELRQFSRQNPGQNEVSHKEYQFSRQNPGQTELSHQEYKYQKSEKQYRFRTRVERPSNEVERKFVKGYDFVSGGQVTFRNNRGQNVTVSGHWVQSSGWHQIPDNVINAYWGTGGVPQQYIGGSEQRPRGNVTLNMYGGPNVTIPYYATMETIQGGYTEWGPWTDWSSTNPGNSTAIRDVETRTVTTDYKNGTWTTDTPGSPWVKVDERKVIDQEAVAPFTEYRAQNGSATTDVANAGWFKESSFTGWSRFGDAKKVIDQEAVAPFTEYRAQDGSATTNLAQAGWFRDTAFNGWNQYGQPQKVVEQEAVDPFTEYLAKDESVTTDVSKAGWFDESSKQGWSQFNERKVVDSTAVEERTLYLTRDTQGNLGESTDRDEAAVFTSDSGVDQTVWTEFGREKVVEQEAVDPFTEYLAKDESVTTDVSKAGWFDESSKQGWSQFNERKVVDSTAVEERTLYLTRDTQGNLGESTDRDEAAVFTSDSGVDQTVWTEFGREKVVKWEATPDRLLYLTQDQSGAFGETNDPKLASWVDVDEIDDAPIWMAMVAEQGNPLSNRVTPWIWQPMVDEQGNPLVRTVVDQQKVPGYTEYYSEDGRHSLELGEHNWTTDEPEGWTFIDRRKVVDQASWIERVKVPAETAPCELPKTGSDTSQAIGLAGAMLLGGGALVAMSRRQRRNENTGDQPMNS